MADHVDLRPEGHAEITDGDWDRRLRVSSRYYDELLHDPAQAAAAFASDLAPLGEELALCHGRVIDIGGGNGLVREYLPDGVEYVSIDPDVSWLDARWDRLAAAFPCLREPLAFIRGRGEALPCADGSFDAALALFSLNHTAHPARVVADAARVLRPASPFLVVLEDIEPGVGDILSGGYADWRGWRGWRLAAEKLRARVAGWPHEPDHVPIRERDFRRWIRGRFGVERRSWRGSYLVYLLRKLGQS
ncbi:MAG TPA: class I SAM-dependent methyltransferase [Vicinamibacterales bacterium]